MSKVVTYLRLDIPRILINRNIVRVNSTTDDEVLFHACLLGNCGKSKIVTLESSNCIPHSLTFHMQMQMMSLKRLDRGWKSETIVQQRQLPMLPEMT